MSKRLSTVCVLLSFLLMTTVGVAKHFADQALSWSFAPPELITSEAQSASFETVFDYSAGEGIAHSAAIRMKQDAVGILWFDGSREGAQDVVLKERDIRFKEGAWIVGDVGVLTNRRALTQHMDPPQAVLKLGNTIQFGESTDKLLATVVSLGGWAAASIAMVDTAEGEERVHKLPLSPFINRSHLVRTPMVPYTDGSFGLPAYLELGNAFGEWVRMDSHGKVRDKRRMSQGRFGIQPMVVPLDAQNAVALMRNFERGGDRLIATWTTDGGQSWSPAEHLDPANPNAPVAAIRLAEGRLLMAYNDQPDQANSLSLAISEDKGRS